MAGYDSHKNYARSSVSDRTFRELVWDADLKEKMGCIMYSEQFQAGSLHYLAVISDLEVLSQSMGSHGSQQFFLSISKKNINDTVLPIF